MGRRDNQDYYKVAGKMAEGRDGAASNRAKLGTERAALRHAAPRPSPAIARQKKPAEQSPEMATVHHLHGGKPRHGKKRRSTRKRHETTVIQEHHAEVIDVRGRAEQRPPPKAAMPNAAPAVEPRILRYGRGVIGRTRGLYEFAKELLLAPYTLVQLLREMRERQA